jgi:hypothetical protein
MNLKRIVFFVSTCTCIFAMAGCARIVYDPVISDDNSNGFRYYNSSPYLLVYSNGKGGLITQIVYLPDPMKKMTASPKSFLSTIQTTMDFDHGVFKSAKNTTDATVVSSAIVKAVESAAPALLAALNEPAQDRTVPPPYLYKIIVDNNTIKFVGGAGDIDIKVNILKQTEEKTK